MMHEKKIIHRDLKPDNILLASESSDVDLRICDFGLAVSIQNKCFVTGKCGSPGFVAPEILRDLPYNTQADIFSAGAILYCLATGKQLFE